MLTSSEIGKKLRVLIEERPNDFYSEEFSDFVNHCINHESENFANALIELLGFDEIEDVAIASFIISSHGIDLTRFIPDIEKIFYSKKEGSILYVELMGILVFLKDEKLYPDVIKFLDKHGYISYLDSVLPWLINIDETEYLNRSSWYFNEVLTRGFLKEELEFTLGSFCDVSFQLGKPELFFEMINKIKPTKRYEKMFDRMVEKLINKILARYNCEKDICEASI